MEYASSWRRETFTVPSGTDRFELAYRIVEDHKAVVRLEPGRLIVETLLTPSSFGVPVPRE